MIATARPLRRANLPHERSMRENQVEPMRGHARTPARCYTRDASFNQDQRGAALKGQRKEHTANIPRIFEWYG